MTFDQNDIERGYKDCSCGKRFVLEAGTDYPDECWEQCGKCYSWVINLEKEKKDSVFAI